MAEEDFLAQIDEFLENSDKISCKLPKYKLKFDKPKLDIEFPDKVKEKKELEIVEKKKNGRRQKSKQLF